MKIVDLSVSIIDGLPVDKPVQIPKIKYRRHTDEESVTTFLNTYPGLTKEQMLDGHGWAIEQISLSTHTGTHVDAPYHYHPTMNGGEPAWTVDQVPLEWCMGQGVVFDFSDKPDGYICTSEDFKNYLEKIHYTLKPGDVVLLHTNAMTEWGTPADLDKGCGVGREGTLWLIEQGVHTVGTDAWSWDIPQSYAAKLFQKTGDPSVCWEGHKAGAEKAYIQYEKLTNLDQLPPYGFKFMGLPIKVDQASAGWVRAIAIMEDEDNDE